MAIKSNVQETTTSTGVGDITLAGVSEDGRTFTSQYSLNEQFTYYIDDRAGNFETGIGYLSAASTLVRVNPLEGSAALPVNFGAGTKQVFVGSGVANTSNQALGFSSISGNKFMKGANCIRPTSTHSASANRLHYVYFVCLRGVFIDSLAVAITTAGGTVTNKMHLGIYDVKDGNPYKKLASTTDLDPSATGFISGTFPEIFLQAGLYYTSVWVDATTTLRASDGSIVMDGGANISADTNLRQSAWKYNNSQVGLTDLPDLAAPTNEIFANASVPIIMVGHT